MTIITSIINALQEHWHYGRWLWALLWKSLAAIATSLLHRVTHTLPAHTHTQAECKAKLCIWSRCYERIQSLHTPAIYLLWLAQVSRNKGVTVAVTHTPRYTHPLPCQLSLHPLPLSPSCGYTSSKPQFHTQTHPASPGWLQDLVWPKHSLPPCCVVTAYLPHWMTDWPHCWGAQCFSPSTNGSSASHHCTHPQQWTHVCHGKHGEAYFWEYFPHEAVFFVAFKVSKMLVIVLSLAC